MKARLSMLLATCVFLSAPFASATDITGAVGVTSQGDMTYRVGLTKTGGKPLWGI